MIGLLLPASRRRPIRLMITVASVLLFLLGVVLLLLSVNTLTLHRSKIPREFRRSAGAKSAWLIVGGILFSGSGLVLFVVRAVSAP